MARAIATITGTGLAPGVSKNRRWYKPEHVAGAVVKAQERIAAGRAPMVMLTFHEAGDDSKEIAASLTSASLAEDGRLRFSAALTDTPAGWSIAKLADTSDGQPAHLRNVSIRGAWTGRVRKERGPDGQMVETADGLELDGIDFTKSPGVEGAEIETFAWASGGQNETTERVLITESLEGTVTVTETTEDGLAPLRPVPDDVREAVRAVLAPAEVHVLDNGLCVTCVAEKKGGKTPYGDVTYADPGYQQDKVKRYPLDTPAHVRAAWSYVNVQKNAAKYTAGALKRIRGRIKAAMGRIGAKVSAESDVVAGFVIGEAVQAPEAVLEWLGDNPKRSGSWSVSASNGPVNLNLSSYCMDPADLNVILRAAAGAACDALKALDPDMDGDVDVPGAGSSDTDDDGGHETAPEDDAPATETAPPEEGGGTPAPAGPTESEDSMPETTATTTEAGAGAPAGLTLESIQKTAAEAAAAAVAATFEARDAARAKAKKQRREAAEREAREAAARKTALTEALTELGIKVPAPGETAPAATESGESAALTEADVEKRVEQRVGEALTEFKQQLLASGAILPSRAGIVVREHAVPNEDEAPDGEALRKMGDDDLMTHLGGAMAQYADSIRPVG